MLLTAHASLFLSAPTLPECARAPSHALDYAALAVAGALAIGGALYLRRRALRAVKLGALRALVQAAKAGEEAAGYRSLGRMGPILRALCRRRIARALRDAWEGAEESGVSETQTLQRAAVALATGQAAPTDPAALHAAFATIEAQHGGVAPPPSRGPLVAMAGLAAAAAVAAVLVMVRNADDASLRTLLQKRAPRYRIELNNTLLVKDGEAAGHVNPSAKAALDRMKDTLAAEMGKTRLGQRGSATLAALLDREQQASASSDTALDDEIRGLAESAGALNRLLAQHRAEYLVSTDVTVRNGRRTVQFFTFDVEERAATCVEGRMVRLAHVRRLDEVNWNINGVGLVFEREGLVVLDEIEKLIVHELLPALAVDEATSGMGPAEHAVVREDLGRIGEWDAKEQAEVAELLASRKTVMTRVARSDADGFTTDVRYDTWKGRAADGDLLELQRVEDKLQLRRDGYKKIERAFALSVERWVAQSVRDSEPDATHPVPAELRALTGDSAAIAGQVAIIAHWIASDLAELGANDVYPRTQLAMLVRSLDDPGNFKWYAAIVIIEALARELGIEVDAKNAGSVAKAKQALLKQPQATLPEAARKARRRMFGSEGGGKGRCAGRDVFLGLGSCR